jgi:hypothetical protein
MSTITSTLSNEKRVAAEDRVRSFARAVLWALPIWAAMLFLGTFTHQPDPQTDFASFAAYVTTRQFFLSHLVNSIGGAAIGSIGVIGLMLYLQDSKAAGKAITGMVATVAGNILMTPVFGAAAFTQTALGHAYIAGQENILELYNMVYSAPLFGTAFLGLLLFMVGGAFSGAAVITSGQLPRWTGWLYVLTTVGFVLSFIIIPVGQSPMSALFVVSTVGIAWSANRK